MAVLLLRFSAPFQSWGTSLKLSDHPTNFFPSKSAVIGMIASAEGRRRDEDISDLSALGFSVRIDSAGTPVRDFQTAKIRRFTAERNVKNSNSFISHRDYLSGASFTVALEGEREALADIAYNLNHPANALFFGRRCCPVNADLVSGIFEEESSDLLHAHGYQKGMRLLLETTEDGDRMIRDVPISFDFHRREYRYRMIKEIM